MRAFQSAALICSLMLTGAASDAAAAAMAAPSPSDLAVARRTIDAANADWINAMQAQDAGRVVRDYADDALAVGPSGRVISGRAAAQADLAKRFAAGLKVSGGELRQGGLEPLGEDLLLEWGWGAFTAAGPDGQVQRDEGPYVTVWRRAPDGVWRIVRNLSL